MHFFLVIQYIYIGDDVIKIGDFVTRKSYSNDIIFKVIDIKNDIYYLCGKWVRLYADSPLSDLVVAEDFDDSFECEIEEFSNLDRNDYFYLPGRVLHLDGDKDFLDKCMKFYSKNKIKANGIYLKECDFKYNIRKYLEMYNPDILIITGHDSMYKRSRDGNNYKNTSNFIDAVREARSYEKSHEKLIIIAGACQSNYEELIKNGANFASSPKRINIHALDPAIIATSLAFSDKNTNIDLINILSRTKYGSDGIGGIITKGTMYIGYPRE